MTFIHSFVHKGVIIKHPGQVFDDPTCISYLLEASGAIFGHQKLIPHSGFALVSCSQQVG